jgi:hypothetical protein
MRSDTRTLVLAPIEGEKIKSSTGLVDPGLFTGENNLFAIMDTQTCLWCFKYKRGGLPPALKQRFTSFDRLLEYARNYFRTRGIQIVEVLD